MLYSTLINSLQAIHISNESFPNSIYAWLLFFLLQIQSMKRSFEQSILGEMKTDDILHSAS